RPVRGPTAVHAGAVGAAARPPGRPPPAPRTLAPPAGAALHRRVADRAGAAAVPVPTPAAVPGRPATLTPHRSTATGHRAGAQLRSISATRKASSSDCWVFSRGSQAVS